VPFWKGQTDGKGGFSPFPKGSVQQMGFIAPARNQTGRFVFQDVTVEEATVGGSGLWICPVPSRG
jgi:hypothetical protein